MPLARIAPRIRFMRKVEVDGNGCWNWNGFLNHNGYARFWDGDDNVFAHRWAYEDFVGPIGDGLQIDHLCRNRRCVNPEHLEVVTAQVNQLRSQSFSGLNAAKTECRAGHDLTGPNLYITPNGRRNCRMCRLAAVRRYQLKKVS